MVTLTIITKDNGKRRLPFDEQRLRNFVSAILADFPHLKSDKYIERTIKTITSHEEYKAEEITNKLILNALDNITIEEPDWTFVAARVYLKQLYKQAASNRWYDASEKYGSYYG